MQGLHAGEAGRRPQPTQFAGVDLRRPKGYQPPPPQPPPPATEGDPCPRCESRDTKFCYYNNYNTSQPRHFCKGCRRYWTKGGTLRNVPVGGGSRKSSPAAKRSKPSKRRRVAPPELAPPKSDPSPTAAAPTEVSTQGANELAAPAATDGGFKNLELPEPMAGLGLGFLDTDVKASVDPNPFEWPPAFDVSSYWAQNGFADVDPTLFLNLP